MATPRAKKPAPKRPAAPTTPPKRRLPPALAARARALHDASQARLVHEGREAIALIRERREAIADDYFDVGHALITLKREAVAEALGYDDAAALLREELDLSITTANTLIELATRVDRSVLRELQQERAAAILALVDATPEDDTLEGLLAKPFPNAGGDALDLRTAPVAAIKAVARALRQKHSPGKKRAGGFTTTPADRRAFAALVAPVTKDKALRGVAAFKLIASRGEHGPLVESRIPLSEFARVTARLHMRR